jgi:hypothetical protein
MSDVDEVCVEAHVYRPDDDQGTDPITRVAVTGPKPVAAAALRRLADSLDPS